MLYATEICRVVGSTANHMSFQAWDTYFAPLNSLNFGIGGDCTEHVLWRIENGELDGINPKVKKFNSF